MDRREAILARLFTVAGIPAHTPPFTTRVRNRAMIDPDKRPTFVMLDGTESEAASQPNRGRVALSPSIMILRPQLFVLLKTQKPTNETVGQLLNEYRVAMLKAIGEDPELLELVGDNGNIRYHGCLTDLQSGSSMEGQMQLNLSLSYPLNPFEL